MAIPDVSTQIQDIVKTGGVGLCEHVSVSPAYDIYIILNVVLVSIFYFNYLFDLSDRLHKELLEKGIVIAALEPRFINALLVILLMVVNVLMVYYQFFL